jgi:hypothetical protein
MPDFSFEAQEKRWHLSPLSLGDMRAFKEWVQLKAWFMLQAYKDKLPPELYDAESKRVLTACMDKELQEDSPEVEAAMRTSEGIAQLVYLSLRRNHPAITAEQTADILTTRNLAEVADLLMACSGMGGKKKVREEETPESSQ